MLKRVVRTIGIGFTAVPLLLTNVQSALADTGFIIPNSDTYAQFSTVGSSNHYQNVDDGLSCNGLTDYNYTTDTSKTDGYNFPVSSIPNGSSVTAMEVWPCASTTDTTNDAHLNIYAYFDGNLQGASYPLFLASNGTTPYNSGPYTITFPTPITKTSGSKAEVRVRLNPNDGGGIRLSRLKVNFHY